MLNLLNKKYNFVGNNPVNFSDPYGLSAISVTLPIAGGFAVGDGPLPVGDLIGVALIAGAGAYDLWQYWNENTEDSDSGDDGEQCDVPTSPPDGLVENPNRPGSWGEYDTDGKFQWGQIFIIDKLALNNKRRGIIKLYRYETINMKDLTPFTFTVDMSEIIRQTLSIRMGYGLKVIMMILLTKPSVDYVAPIGML